jgi:hypothetical protein
MCTKYSQNPQIAQLNHQMRSFQHHYVTGSSSPVLKGLQIGITAHKARPSLHVRSYIANRTANYPFFRFDRG